MAKQALKIPALVHHKTSDRARVRIKGHDFWLGKFGTEEAEEKYRRIVAEYVATGQVPVPQTQQADQAASLTVAELIAAYRHHVEAYYVKDGKPTSEQWLIRDSLKVLRQLYGTTAVADFGPLKLKAVREAMIGRGWHRKTINSRIGKVRRMFKWAAGNEMIPPSVFHGLAAVEGIRKGRSKAPESAPVRPVDDAAINAVLPHLNRQTRAMVKLQVFTGMRPGEVCSLRPCDVNRDGDVWMYRPAAHKTLHHDIERVVYIGLRAQTVLAEWLDNRPADAFCFSPREAYAERMAAKRAARKTRVQPSQQDRSRKNARKLPAERYSPNALAIAVTKACDAAGVEHWSPNRLRHSFGTAVRKGFGLEAAQVTLGHSNARVTEVYAERNTELGKRVALEIG